MKGPIPTMLEASENAGNGGEQSVLVIGCGYLGAQLLREFGRTRWKATGITLSESSADALRSEGLEVVAADLRTSDLRVLTKNNPSVVIHCASSDKGGAVAYREIFLETITRLIQDTTFEHLIFTSSTSVYAQADGSVVTETNPAEPERETGKILRETEELVLAHNGTVLRLAGIYGPGRCVPLEKLFSGEAVIEGDGERIINSIHRDDAVSALYLAASNRCQGIFNVADNAPVTQLEWFQWVCARLGRPLPPFSPRDLNRKRAWTSKRVGNAKLRSLGWSPAYPSFRDGVEEMINERR
ncbi:MAG: NAD-dependent epimerase/dehydratase family protein [Verrucomicrobia bacterium]|nr:NAD-dependent epimerase/dehydratase family protein [Verrucomicrobiota bacterium]MBV8485502.1 NAD-dependent epimerase/dehydratase family protein [Verrucomicrobiota bacterium]